MAVDDSDKLIRDIAPFGLRMPQGLKDRVKAAAAENNRSMNAEIVATLEDKYPEPRLPLYEDFVHYLLSLPNEQGLRLLHAMTEARELDDKVASNFLRDFLAKEGLAETAFPMSEWPVTSPTPPDD